MLCALDVPPLCCAPGVLQFARLMHAYELVYCLLPRDLAGAGGRARRAALCDSLDTFFPFDPYRLAESMHFVQPHYRMWTEAGCRGDAATSCEAARASPSSSGDERDVEDDYDDDDDGGDDDATARCAKDDQSLCSNSRAGTSDAQGSGEDGAAAATTTRWMRRYRAGMVGAAMAPRRHRRRRRASGGRAGGDGRKRARATQKDG